MRPSLYKQNAWKSRGQSLLEFALLLPAFMFTIAGIFDLSRGVFYYNNLSEAARSAVRYAIVNGENSTSAAGPCPTESSCDCSDATAPNTGAIRSAAVTRTIAMDTSTSALTVTCSWPDQNSAGTYLNSRGKRVSVTLSYVYQPILTSFIPGANITLQGGATSYIQY